MDREYIVTAFYCEVCKEWHRLNELEFHDCMDKYNAHFSFKVKVKELLNG